MADEKPKSNVIPFAVNGVTFTDLGPPTDLTTVALADLVNAIEAEGEPGPLANSREWLELKRRLNLPPSFSPG